MDKKKDNLIQEQIKKHELLQEKQNMCHDELTKTNKNLHKIKQELLQIIKKLEKK